MGHSTMPTKPRKWLLAEVERQLVPVLKSSGFAHGKISNPFVKPGTGYPLGQFSRFREDGAMETVEFQFDKSAAPMFRISFAIVPKNGAEGLPQHDCVSQSLEKFYLLCPKRNGHSWFKLPWYQRHTSENTTNYVARLTPMLSEVTGFFDTGEQGKHVYLFDRSFS